MTSNDTLRRADLARDMLDSPILADAIGRLVGEKLDKIIELPMWTPWAWRKRRELIAEVRALKNVQSALADEIFVGEQVDSRGLGVA